MAGPYRSIDNIAGTRYMVTSHGPTAELTNELISVLDNGSDKWDLRDPSKRAAWTLKLKGALQPDGTLTAIAQGPPTAALLLACDPTMATTRAVTEAAEAGASCLDASERDGVQHQSSY
jgi:hypothetical protein|eukprot:7381581-Prymnesium_polylepis.1